MSFPRGNAPSACEKIFVRAVSTWKRPCGSAATPQEVVGSIVHSFAPQKQRFHVETGSKHPQEFLASQEELFH